MSVVYHYNPTSNRNSLHHLLRKAVVVYHYNPTSNRNVNGEAVCELLVVYHYNPTSNRNNISQTPPPATLYIIIILHQTATNTQICGIRHSCISL